MPEKDVQQPAKIAQLFTLSTMMRAAVLFSMLFTLILLKLPFYGDQATLVSSPAQYYYDSGFSSLFLPAELETGHPPLYPLLIAMIWSLVGKSLAAVHVVSFFCLLFLLVQVYRLIKQQFAPTGGVTAMLFVLCFPVLWAQVAGMGCDVLLVALVLYVVNRKPDTPSWLLILALAVMPLISMRGWIWIMATGLHALYYEKSVRARLQVVVLWASALVPVLVYYAAHNAATGWWLLPEPNNWANHRSLNTPVLAAGKLFEGTIRLVEFGMLIPVIVWSGSLVGRLRRKEVTRLDAFIICGGIALAFFVLPFRGPIVIRYILPVHLAILIASATVFSKRIQTAGRRAMVLPALICVWMVSCHFYAYPQMRRSLFEYSWGDGSLAHLGYFAHRKEAQVYLENHQLSRAELYTAFPETKSYYQTNLIGDTTACRTLTHDNIHEAEWVLYSNVMNMIDFELTSALQKQFTVVQQWESYPVITTLYHRQPERMQN